MRYAIILSTLLLGAALPASAQVTLNFGVPGQSIGMNMPVYQDFQRVPNYPVYYAPKANQNVFFYDGMYWAYQKNNWYASSWYNGPWAKVSPKYVPDYVLRVPVRYYGARPSIFTGGPMTRRRAGASTTDPSGNRNEAVGTPGTAVQLRRPLHCRSISGSTRVTDIPAMSSKQSSERSTTTTSRASLSCARPTRRRPSTRGGTRTRTRSPERARARATITAKVTAKVTER